MRVAVVTQWFTDGLGYSENLLPASLARTGAEVHIISGRGNVYAHTPKYDSIYRPVLGEPEQPCGSYPTDTSAILHRIASTVNVPDAGAVKAMLKRIRPDVVQTFGVVDQWSLDCADFCEATNTPLFTENHVHESVIPRGPWQTPRGWLVGLANRIRPAARRVNSTTTLCFAISADTYRVAHRRFGVPRSKLRIEPLGVDTDTFHPPTDGGKRRIEVRGALGIAEDEVVCIYTGRLSEDKSPSVLAEAVALLRGQGHPVRAIFVGAGTQAYVSRLEGTVGCRVLPFRPTAALPELYQAADIGVWPREESTSQLDAMACGLPLIVSDKVRAEERLGVGGSLREGSPTSLASVIAALLPRAAREAAGAGAHQRVQSGLSWRSLAAKRMALYSAALGQS